jgi:hypothetical protein
LENTLAGSCITMVISTVVVIITRWFRIKVATRFRITIIVS